MTKDEMCVELRVHIIRKYGTMAEAARVWGVSTALVSAVANGHKRPNQIILDDMGIERVEPIETYRRKKKDKEQA